MAYNDEVNDVTNINANSKSFDFLAKEPGLYVVKIDQKLKQLFDL